MMALILLLLIFAPPICQIILISKKLKGKISLSILSITGLMVLFTIILSILAIIADIIEACYRKDVVKCDMTIPGIIVFDFFLCAIIIPLIGIIGGLTWNAKNNDLPASSKPADNPYRGFLKQSQQDLKRWN